MIRVTKPSTPDILREQGEEKAKDHCDDYELVPGEYRSGVRTFKFADIYKADAVKDALRTAQYSKCAFCESYFTHIAYGDIEHFRPKGGFRQRESDELRYPGYYWLAYEWSNLFYSCQLCNQRFKRNLFPLRDGRSRARTHNHDLANEDPLLIDPAKQNPETYISFRREEVFAINDCLEGDTTIKALGLDREELVERRRDRLAQIEHLIWCRELLVEKAATSADPTFASRLRAVEATLQSSRDATAEYAAMARAFLGRSPPGCPRALVRVSSGA